MRGRIPLAFLLAFLAALPARAEILVALAWDTPGTGPVQGVNLAVEWINRSGGLLGQSLRIAEFDDGCQEKQAVMVAHLVTRHHPALVVGHGCSASTVVAAPIYDAAGTLLLAPTATNTKVTDLGLGSVFRVTGRDDRQAEAAASLIAQRWARSRIALLDDRSVYGQDLTKALAAELAKRQIPVALNTAFRSRTTDHSEMIAKLRDNRIEIVYVAAAWSQDIGMILREMQGAGLNVEMLSADSANNIGSWAAGKTQRIPLFFTFLKDPLQSPSAASVLWQAKERAITLNRVSLLAYAGIEAWAQAVREANSVDAQTVAQILHQRKFRTVIGEIAFDAKGDLAPPASDWVWYRWHDGKRDPLARE